MKKKPLLMMSLLFVLSFGIAGLSSCSSDDETVVGGGLIGKWRLVETQNGPIGAPQPAPYTMEIKGADEWDGTMGRYGGTIVYTFDNGDRYISFWKYSDDESIYSTSLPVILITHQSVTDSEEECGSYVTPYGCEISSTTLKLHYLGFYFTDHIPETYVYKKI